MPADSLDRALIYRGGSAFQRWAYEHAAEYFNTRGVRRYGRSKNGNPYAHLLHPDDVRLNFLSASIADAVGARFDSHKAGDRARTETNTVASQFCCFNLFVPLALDLPLASDVFSQWMDRAVAIDHIELEFTPNHLAHLAGYELELGDESLGDQSGSSGTDADVAIFYRSGTERGVLLIEFKYIEAEFSMCSSYNADNRARKALLRPVCDSPRFVPMVMTSNPEREQALCGYSRYRNWVLTQQSSLLEWEKSANLPRCAFAGSGQQLWRNLLLAENLARQRRLHVRWKLRDQGSGGHSSRSLLGP